MEALIAAAEKEYQEGRANYRPSIWRPRRRTSTGPSIPAAAGPGPIRGDERLEHEFEKIADGVYQLELLALKDRRRLHRAERGARRRLTRSNEVTFPVDPNVKAKAEAELKETPGRTCR